MLSRLNRKLLLISFLGGSLMAREFRTPWALLRGYLHNPIPRPKDCDDLYNYDVWLGGLHREANKAFPNKNSVTTEGSLAGIVFGQDAFTASQSFAPDTIFPDNPFVPTAVITPNFVYRENAAYFGATAERALGCDYRWHVGGRVILPFRSIKMQVDDCCDQEETLSDMCRIQNERIDGTAVGASPAIQTVNGCYAYRLDFLASLFMQQAGVPPFEPFVVFQNTAQGNDITMGDIIVSDANNNPVHLIQRDDTTAPQGTFCLLQPSVNALPFLPANGEGIPNNQGSRFQQPPTDYTPLGNNIEAQRRIWVTPTVNNNGFGTLELVDDAQTIGSDITSLTRIYNRTALDFLQSNSVSLGTQKVMGVGNLTTEIYANYEWCKVPVLAEGWLGIVWPTDVKVKNPGQVYKIFTTGNDNHFELRAGTMGCYDPFCWFNVRADIMGSYVFSHTEKVAAPFTGATIKNIGPTIDGKISWYWFYGHVACNFMAPYELTPGLTIGYEWYYKSKDRVSLNQSTAVDFEGNVRPLDANVLEMRTNVISHKAFVEMFHQGCGWQLFGGWSGVFAGKNAPKDIDWYIGFVTYF